MNGAQSSDAAAAQAQALNQAQQAQAQAQASAPPTTADPPLMAGANGSSSLNKKRKKDGLKPIITTEGPTPAGGAEGHPGKHQSAGSHEGEQVPDSKLTRDYGKKMIFSTCPCSVWLASVGAQLSPSQARKERGIANGARFCVSCIAMRSDLIRD
ncbi:hypothetical protein BJ170DRAFT_593990 [Xylariales sp. AK1849]|nr:hypothetical protein BJ170DRAFT_593990 [Xylariales sp. AK1849]